MLQLRRAIYHYHKCKPKCFVLIVEDYTDPDIDTTMSFPDDVVDTPPPDVDRASSTHISFHALLGQLAPETLRVKGHVNGHEVITLIDMGRTHNFVQAKMVRFLKLKTQPTKLLHVMIGNGNELTCQQVCKGARVTIQGQYFVVDLHVMAIGGADLVLGLAWMKNLGPIVTDYSLLTMKFMKEDQSIEYKGETSLRLREITCTQVRRLLTTDRAAAFFHIQITPATSTLDPATNLTPPRPSRCPHHSPLRL